MPIIRALSAIKKSQNPFRKTNRRRNQKKKVSYQVLEPRHLLAALPLINEFVASNNGGLLDDNGSTSDWIEIYNAGDQSVNLAGYSLTDDAGDTNKYTFPSQTLGVGQYLVVFASDDADTTSGTDLYTGFKLSSSGEYIGLYDSAGVLLSAFAAGGADYPTQIANVSYGYVNDGNFSQPSYFSTPTPGSPNTNPVAGIVERVSSSVTPGFYDTAFTVSLTTPTAGATIRYTTDGSTPTATNGTTYSGPISVTGTTNLRSVATRTSYLSVPDRTWSYIFVDDVLDQVNNDNSNPPAGWPSDWGQATDYGLDPEVFEEEGGGNSAAQIAAGKQAVKDALLAIPTWSVTTDLDNLFHPSTGIYANPGQDGINWERPASIEQLNPDGTAGFQANAGIRIRGGASRTESNPKHAFKFFFRSEYGDSSLEYDIFADDPTSTTSFQKIDLRTAQNYSWSKDGNSSNAFIMDRFARLNQAALGQQATRSHWVHLYLNGQYFGLYETQERADANFGASYFGGDADNYDVLKPERGPYQNIATDGNFTAYNDLFQQALARGADGVTPAFADTAAYMKAQGLNPDGTANPAYETLLDVENLTAYMIVILHGGNFDAPISNFLGNNRINNYFAIRDRTGNEGFRFFVHDAEHSYRDETRNRNGPWNHSNFESSVGYFNPQWLHQQLMANDEYRIQFADKIQEAFFNDGPMTVANLEARIDAEAAKLDQAIIAESARWGDAKSGPYFRSHWVNAVNTHRNRMAGRHDNIINQWQNTNIQLKDASGNYTVNIAAPLLPNVDAPINQVENNIQSGGPVTAGDSLSFIANDAVYYTVDGSDPRLEGGGINPNALIYNPSVTTSTLFTTGSIWKYLDSGANLGTAWQASSYNDAAWASGASQLGYANGETTTVSFGNDSSNKHITTYFRKTFNAAAGSYAGATLRLKRDDGAVAYLNGVEIARSNMPGGTITSTTTAASTVGGGAESTWFDFTFNPGLLNAGGSNTLAVEIHQTSGTSSDITFDAELNVSQQSSQSQPYILNTSTNVQARTLSSGTWSAVHDATYVIPASQSELRISEIHFNPSDATATEIAAGIIDNDEFEFLEIYNPNPVGTINLAGAQLSNGVTFTFGDYDLLPGERAVVVENIDAFMARYGNSATVLGQWSGALNNGGEKVTLIDSSLAEVMTVDYGDNDPWYIPTDGHGFSLVLDQPATTPTAELGKYYSWRPSTEFGGTPGAASVSPLGIVINEVLTHTDAPQTDTIELYNPTGAAINVGGWYLSDEGSTLLKYQIPAGTVIGAGGYLVFDETDFNPTPLAPAANHFALNSSLGDQVYLSRASGGTLIGLEDSVEFDATFNGVSMGRLPNGPGRLTRLAASSFGAVNGVHDVGPLVISEVNYHPAAPSTTALAIEPTLTDNDLEFIEIANPTASTVDLSNWRLRGEADYDFASGTSIPAGGTITVLAFDPADPLNASKLAAFKAHYGIVSTANMVGALSASLSNSTGRVALQQPDTPDLTVIPRVVVDEVVYDDLSPWANADGNGQSLNRNGFTTNGSLAASWIADSASPGTTNLATAPSVLSAVVNNGGTQRSTVTSLVVTLDGDVVLDPGAINVVQRNTASGTTGTTVGTSHTTAMVGGNTVVTISFTDHTRNGIGALEDGNYQLTVDGSNVRRNGSTVTMGQNYVFGDTAGDNFFTYFGDHNGDRTVTAFDLLFFRQTYRQSSGAAGYNAAMDYNNDGTVNALDLLFFRQRYRRTLPFV